jgi:uncharacterized protein (TIGR03435 family)
MRTATTLAGLLTLAIASVAAQAPSAPAFEAVSIKVNDSGRDGGGSTPLRNGRWNATNVPLVALIGSAWGAIPSNRIFNAPDWARLTRYDIAAVAPETATQEQVWPMVQTLLRDRFKVLAHTAMRDLPIYNLVAARTDGRLGPGLRSATIDCDAPDWRERLKDKPSARPCGFSWDTGVYTGGGQHLSTIASLLTAEAGRPVFDKTGLSGVYDFDLKWTPGLGVDPAGTAISIFTAIQDQLGLKLESATAPLEVLIVDRAERPTPN